MIIARPIRAATLCALAATALSACTTTPMPDPAASAAALDATVARQIAAIKARDLDALLTTVTTQDDLLLIFPNGVMTTTRSAYIDFHRTWFADTAWSMELTPIESSVEGGYGHVLLRTAFDPDGPSGPETGGQSWLTMGFRLEGGEWRLVHDQNTRIAVE